MNLSLLLGGVILFIYSIDLLTNDLLKLSIDKIKQRLKRLTSSISKSFTTGFILTALVQSSSALIMITIALINANMLTFNDSIGLLLGSNVATTLTSFIVGLNLEKYAAFILVISLLIGLIKKEKYQRISKIVFSIGLIFFSIFLISEASISLENNPHLYEYIDKVASNFFLSLIVGTLLTATLQSSSVFIAIIQVLAMSGFISTHQAIPLIFGANIGTSFDAVITLFSANKESKKLAHFSIFFNICTVIIFSVFIHPFTFVIDNISSIINANEALSIAIINITFNTLGVLVTLPFIKRIKAYYAKW